LPEWTYAEIVTPQSVQIDEELVAADGEKPTGPNERAAHPTSFTIPTDDALWQRIEAHRVTALVALACVVLENATIRVAAKPDPLMDEIDHSAYVMDQVLYELGAHPDEHWPPSSAEEMLAHFESPESWSSHVAAVVQSKPVLADKSSPLLFAARTIVDELSHARAGKRIPSIQLETLRSMGGELQKLVDVLVEHNCRLIDEIDLQTILNASDPYSTSDIFDELRNLAREENRAVLGPLVDAVRSEPTHDEYLLQAQRSQIHIEAYEAVEALGLNIATAWVLAHGNIDTAFANLQGDSEIRGADAWMAMITAETERLGGTYAQGHLYSLLQLSHDLFGAIEQRRPPAETRQLFTPDEMLAVLQRSTEELRGMIDNEIRFGREHHVLEITAFARREYEPLLQEVMRFLPSDQAEDQTSVSERARRAIEHLRSSPSLKLMHPRFVERLEHTLAQRSALQTRIRNAVWQQAEGANINPGPHLHTRSQKVAFRRRHVDRFTAFFRKKSTRAWLGSGLGVFLASAFTGAGIQLSRLERTPATYGVPGDVRVIPIPVRTPASAPETTPEPTRRPEAEGGVPTGRRTTTNPERTTPAEGTPRPTDIPRFLLPTGLPSVAPPAPTPVATSPQPTRSPQPSPSTPPVTSPPVTTAPVTTPPVTTPPVTTPPVTTPPATTPPPEPDPVQTTDNPEPVVTTDPPAPEPVSEPNPRSTREDSGPASAEATDVLAGTFGAARQQLRELAIANADIPTTMAAQPANPEATKAPVPSLRRAAPELV
jgi:hypothetical protein